MKTILSFILIFSFISNNYSQSFSNPSLDGNAGTTAAVPPNWILVKNSQNNIYALGLGSSPDILPGSWGVNILPSDGNAYVGMICRSNGTWESMGHQLTDTLQAGKCYNFTMDFNWKNSHYAGYNNNSAKLRVWGIDNPWNTNNPIDYSTMELLWEASSPGVSGQWETKSISINPSRDFEYLIFDAHWFGSPYQGNILIDNISAITQNNINLDLGQDTVMCQDNTLLLSAFNQGAQYLWNDGSNTSDFSVSSSGNYSVTVSNGACSLTDSINVNYLDLSTDIGNDTSLCVGESLLIDISILSDSIIWNDGSNSQSIIIDSSGNYVATIYKDYCSYTTDININYYDTLRTGLDKIVEICIDDSISLDAGPEFISYKWSNGSNQQSIIANKQGKYYVTVTNINQCSAIDSIEILFKDCDLPEIFIPNAFTPNGDMKNDQFKIEEKTYSKFDLQIFNRWGEKVFESKESSQGWNGKYNGLDCASGVYAYILVIESTMNIQSVYKGDITLLR